MPAPLPPNPAIDLSGDLQHLLSEADRKLGRLDGAVSILANPDLFVFVYVRKEAVLSSQIQGTQSSFRDLLTKELTQRQRGRVFSYGRYLDLLNEDLEAST